MSCREIHRRVCHNGGQSVQNSCGKRAETNEAHAVYASRATTTLAHFKLDELDDTFHGRRVLASD